MATDLLEADTRPSLLLRIRDPHDAKTWRLFVEIYGPLVYRHCRGRGLQDADAAEVAQEVLLQVSQSIRGFEYRPEQGRFRSWLGVVTRHKIHRLLRSRAGRNSGSLDEMGSLAALPSLEQDTSWAEEFNAHVFRAALARVRPCFEAATWRAFELVWLEDQPALDVARVLGQNIGWVYQSKSRVLRRLREEVQLLAEDSAWFMRGARGS